MNDSLLVTATPRRSCSRQSRTASSSPTVPAIRLRPTAPSPPRPVGSMPGVPLFRGCLRQPGARPRPRVRHLYKLGFGHRGINQPVQDRATGRVAVTSHNHGFAVDAPLDRISETPYGRVESAVRPPDGVVEGLRLPDPPAFQVQYHPEAAPRPAVGAEGSCESFVAMMESARWRPATPDLQERPGHRLQPDGHWPGGLRVRLLGRPGLPGPLRGPLGHPGQQQPGDDHDRPARVQRHLRRADHPGSGAHRSSPARAARCA